MKPPVSSERRDAWAIFSAALLFRALHAWRQGLALPLTGDAYEYAEYARNLVETGAYLGPDGAIATRMPGYPLFLALIRLFSGGSPYAVIAVQCALGAATCVLLYGLARRLIPEPWALLCGAISTLYSDLVSPSALVLSESLYSFFLVFSVWALYNEDWKPLTRALGFGALSACLYLVRPEPLPYIVATFLLTPYIRAVRFGRKEVLAGLLVLAGVTGLWVGRNFAHFRRLVPASTISKSVVYISLYLPANRAGLAPEVRYAPPPGLPELDRDALYAAKLRELAGRLTVFQIVKAYLFNFVSILYPFLPAYDWTYMFVLPFALVGLALGPRRRELWPIAGAVVCSLTIFTFCGGWASRYRQGVSPFIVLLGVVGMAAAAERLGRGRFRGLAGAWLGVNLLIWAFQSQARQLALWLRVAVWGH